MFKTNPWASKVVMRGREQTVEYSLELRILRENPEKEQTERVVGKAGAMELEFTILSYTLGCLLPDTGSQVSGRRPGLPWNTWKWVPLQINCQGVPQYGRKWTSKSLGVPRQEGHRQGSRQAALQPVPQWLSSASATGQPSLHKHYLLWMNSNQIQSPHFVCKQRDLALRWTRWSHDCCKMPRFWFSSPRQTDNLSPMPLSGELDIQRPPGR